MKVLEIFDKQIFESDADNWLNLCKEQKKEWILKHTNQADESLISEFINNSKINKDCKCLDCGKTKKNGNFSKANANEITVVEPIEVGAAGKRNNPKRPKRVKS